MSQKFCNILVTSGTIRQLLMFLLGSWRWQTTQDCEIASSPDTLRELLPGFITVLKVTYLTEQLDAEIAWYSARATHHIWWDREGDEQNWIVRCQARLILSESYSPDMPKSWRWRTTLDCPTPNSPDTLRVLLGIFAEVVKVTNNTWLWDDELAWYSPRATHRICRGHKGDEPHWTVRCWARLILSECYSSDFPRLWRWWNTLDSEMPSLPDTLQVLLTRFAWFVKVTNHTGL